MPTTQEILLTIDTTQRIPLDALELAAFILGLPPTDPFFDSRELLIGPANTQFIKENGQGLGVSLPLLQRCAGRDQDLRFYPIRFADQRCCQQAN